MSITHALESVFHVRPSAFGCDVSDHSIRIASLAPGHRKGLELASFGTYPIPEGIIVNGLIANMPAAEKALREAVRSVKGSHLHTPHVVAALPEPQSFLRMVQLPRLGTGEVGEAIKFEIEANIPLPLAEVYYDWEIAPPTVGESGDHLDILVAAVPKALVDSYWQLFTAADLRPIAFEVDALAASRSVIGPKEAAGGAVLVVDIAYHRTTYTITAGGLVRFTSSVPVAGRDLSGEDPKGAAKTLARHARQYVDFFQTHAAHLQPPHGEVKHVILCGDDIAASGIASAMAVELGISVDLANPWVNILPAPLTEVPMLPFKDSLGYAVSLGLALRGVREFSHLS